jgi:phosphohistidine phosphatase
MAISRKDQRTLTVLRHAKSSWKERDLHDIERPLNKRGQRDALAMAARITAKDEAFNTVYASPARRSRDTLLLMLQTLPVRDARIVFDQRLYTFERDALLAFIKQLDDNLKHVMLVGHNPALHDSINWLTGGQLDRFPTAACARMHMTLPRWSDLHPGCAALDWLLTPKDGG